VTALVVLVDSPAALLPSAPEAACGPPPPTVLRVLLEDANAVGLGCVAAVVRAAWADEARARLEDDVAVLPYGDADEALAVLSLLLPGQDGPVVVLHGDRVPAPGVLRALVSARRAPTAASAGILRVAARDLAALARAAAATEGPDGDPLTVLLDVAAAAGIGVGRA
jgi:hypothetical protein